MFFSAIAVIILISVFGVWYQKKYGRKNYLLSRIPSIKRYPVIHHTPYFINKSPKEVFYFFIHVFKEFGDVIHFSLGLFDDAFVMIADAKIAEDILTSQTMIDKTVDYDLLVPWIGTGLLISSGRKWFQRRKILTPAFHFQILEKFVEIMEENSKTLVNQIKSYGDREFNMFIVSNLFALDTVCECAMGIKLDSQKNDSAYARAVKEIALILQSRSYDPLLQINLFYRFTKMYNREKEVIKLMHDFTDNVIQKRREELIRNNEGVNFNEEKKKKKALLDILLTSTINDEPLSNSDIREEVDTFLFAGHDTTTTALSFVFFCLAKYPEIQQKVYEEIVEKIGSDENVTLLKLNDLPYTDLVIKESLRLFPPVAYYGRRIPEEFTSNGITFPKHTNIYISPYLMGLKSEYYENPEIFNPERFNVETTYDKINPFTYVPFSAGPRNCIGQKFAQLVLKSAICKIVRNFKISLSEKCEDQPTLSVEIVLRAVNGIWLKTEAR